MPNAHFDYVLGRSKVIHRIGRNKSFRRADEAHAPCVVLIVYHNAPCIVKIRKHPPPWRWVKEVSFLLLFLTFYRLFIIIRKDFFF